MSSDQPGSRQLRVSGVLLEWSKARGVMIGARVELKCCRSATARYDDARGLPLAEPELAALQLHTSDDLKISSPLCDGRFMRSSGAFMTDHVL